MIKLASVIPSVFIKESNFLKAVNAVYKPMRTVNTGFKVSGSGLKGAQAALTQHGRRGNSTRNALAAEIRAARNAARQTEKNIGNPTPSYVLGGAQDQAVLKNPSKYGIGPSFLDRFKAKFQNPAVAAGTAAGATAIPSYLIGSNLGESSGMEQGLDAGAYQGYMKAMQDAQQRYDNQGLLDRIIGNNPF